MRKTAFLIAIASMLLLWNVTLASATEGTAPEAEAMLYSAIASLKEDEAAALEEFHTFHDRDLYILCFRTTDGKITSHINPDFIDKDVRTLNGPDGASLGQRFYDVAKAVTEEGEITTIDYKFPRPGSTAPVPKQMYLTRVRSQGCGVSYYVH